jgi:hypothetical protein
MDMGGKSIESYAMRRSLPFFASLSFSLALATVACSSGAPPPDTPAQPSEPSETAGSTTESQSGSEGAGEQASSASAPSGTAQAPRDDSNVIPDDYEMMSGDCVVLGNKLGAVVRSDHMAQLSPKLSEEKRSTAEKNIDDVASKMASQWANGCEKSLVGKVVERQRIKCALDSRSLKAFEECINPPAPKN